jgi:hypothetical protein
MLLILRIYSNVGMQQQLFKRSDVAAVSPAAQGKSGCGHQAGALQIVADGKRVV